ncbi:MAG: hypothetical protein V3S08_00740 [Phycisphaerales bacterium]
MAQVAPPSDMGTAVPPPAPSAASMSWVLPVGWTRTDNPSPMRFATLIAGNGDRQIEVAITRLGGRAGGVEPNINRWRGQLGLPPETDEQIARTAQFIDVDGIQGVIVDLAGPGADATQPRMLAAIFPLGANTWFIKTVAPREVIEGHRDGFAELCRSVSFSDSPAQAGTVATPRGTPGAATESAPMTWADPPDGWSADSPPRPMAVASFTITGDTQDAALTITPLGGAQDMLANVNRWRRQLGLGPLGDLAGASPVPIDVDGIPAQLVDIAGADRRTLGAVATRGATTWFFKLTGPDTLVAAQRPAFESFVSSIRFQGDAQ